MATLFISYQSQDRDLAERLQLALKALGHDVRRDDSDLSPGDDWRSKLREMLVTSDAMIVLLTETSLSSSFVMSEIGAARATSFRNPSFLLLPVAVGSVSLPAVIQDVYTIRLPDNTPAQLQDLAKAINHAVVEHGERVRRRFPRIFISHRHRDEDVAKALVQVLEGAFHIEKDDIRCTSVAPYKLRPGERTPDKLRDEISQAKVVLGILTPDTKESSYVLFELGASWGQRVATFPLLAKGATHADIPSPIADINSLELSDDSECHQLIEELAHVAEIRRREGSSPRTVADVRTLIRASAGPKPTEAAAVARPPKKRPAPPPKKPKKKK